MQLARAAFHRLVLGLAVTTALVFGAAAPAEAKLSDAEWSKARKELEAAAAAKNTDGIVAAIDNIAQDGTKRAVDLLLGVGVSLDDIKVYEAVRRALSSATEPEAISHMLDTLKKRSGPGDWTLRCVLCECLSGVQADGVTDAIARCLDDKVPYVTSAAAKSLGKRKDKAAVAPLIQRLAVVEKNKDVVWLDVKQALTDITGHDLADAKEWDDFWKVRGASFDVTADRGDKNESTTVVRPGEESGEFFKEKILAKRIMFVIDTSGSMRANDIPVEGKGTQTRIEVAKSELIRCLKGLKKDVRFNIVAFDSKIRAWQKVQPGAALVKADEGMKADAVKWVSALKPDGMTHTGEALEDAFKPVEVNQIILFSDGAPARVTGGKEEATPTGPILEKILGLNRLRGVKINTFCFAVFETQPGMQQLIDFMRQLAEQNGGKLTLCGGGGRPKEPDPPMPPPSTEPPPGPPKGAK